MEKQNESFNEEGMSPMERGYRRYKKADYNGALGAFTEAVAMSNDHLLLNALDARAGTYVQLDNLQAALRDAKRMIELMPALSKGYLRCGTILKLKGENKLALKIYERGLNKVKIGADKGRTNLQLKYNELRHAQDPGRTRDPLQYLPLEVAEMVCQNLEIRDRVVCLAVSPPWKRLLESLHGLWTTLDTSKVRHAIKLKSLKIHLRRSNFALRWAILSATANFDAPKMEFLTKTCKNLTRLELQGRMMVGESLTRALPQAHNLQIIRVGEGTEIGLSTVQSALRLCEKTLIKASFETVKGNPINFMSSQWPKLDSLTHLRLKANKNSRLDINGLRDATPNVINVQLIDWKIMPDSFDLSGWNKLEIIDLSCTQLTTMPKLPPTVRQLILSNNMHIRFSGEEEFIALPLLETLSCEWTNLDAQWLMAITAPSVKAGNLKRLLAGGRLRSSQSGRVEEEFPPSETLEELSLSHTSIGDHGAIQTTSLYPRLVKLDITATSITGVAVKHFVEMGIKWLKLNECKNVGSDAVEWARGKGVEVIFNFPSQEGKRRIAPY